MYLNYDGIIELNKPLNEEAVAAIQAEKDITYLCFTEAKVGDTSFEVDEYRGGKWLEGEVQSVISVLSPLGYTLNGTLDRWGDYDGIMIIDDDGVEEYDDEDKWVVMADDEEIIEVLQERGYAVLPKRTATDIVWDTDGEEIDLPTEVLIPYDVPAENEADYLSDKYGFCVVSFNLEVAKV